MATVEIVYPDPMPDLRYWLRNDPYVSTLVEGRVFFRLPRTIPGVPMLRISRVGGGAQGNQEAAIMELSIMVEIWGMEGKDYQAVRQTDLLLQHACNQWPSGNLLNPASNTRMNSVSYTTGFDSPDPETGWPRIISHFTAIVTAVGTTTIGQ